MKFNFSNLLLFFLLITSCSTIDLSEGNNEQNGGAVKIVINNLQYSPGASEMETRGFVNPSFVFYHVANDSIGLFPDGGYQIPFSVPLTGDEMAESVEIDANGWRTKQGVKYAAYFPFVYEFKDSKNLPFSYLGQKQTSPSDLSSLAKYSYRYSSQSEYDEVANKFTFTMSDLATIIIVRIVVPVGAENHNWNKIVLHSSVADVFTLKGSVDLFASSGEVGVISPELTSSDVSVLLDDYAKPASASYMDVYLKVPQFVAPTGTIFTCWLYDTEGNSFKSSRSALSADKSYLLGKYNTLGFGSFEAVETGTNTSSANLDNQLNEMDTESTPVKTITIGDNSPKVDAINIPSGVSQSGSSEVNITFQNPVTTTAANTSNTIVVTDNSAANAPVQTESLSDVNLKFAENTGASEVPSLDINLPSSTVTLAPTSGVTHFNVVTTKTARNTLVIKSGVDINKLYVAGGNVVIEAGAHVGEIINSVGAGSTITDWNNGGSTEGSVTATVDGYTSGN